MGQKTNPVGFRLGIIKQWNSRWFASDRNFADLVHEDMMIKRYIHQRLDNAGIAKVVISRAPKKVTVDIMTARPGIVIGRRGAEVDKLREELQLLTKKSIMLNIVEVRKPELDAKLVADSVARQLEGRIAFRRAMKKSIMATMKMGAEGIKIQCAGRLSGAEIARTEKYKDGRVPLHTLRADIDYATSTAHTTYGCIGVKVWICRGEVLEPKKVFLGEDFKPEPDTRGAGPTGRSKRGKSAEGARQRPRGRVRRSAGDAPPKGRRPEGAARKGGRSDGGKGRGTGEKPRRPIQKTDKTGSEGASGDPSGENKK